MKQLQYVKAIAFALVLSTSTLVHAGEILPYSTDAFERAKASGGVLLLGFHAEWCSTCKAQSAALKALQTSPEFKHVTVLKADFDREKALEKTLGVTKQSTLIVYRKGAETIRATGLTGKNEILKLVTKAQ